MCTAILYRHYFGRNFDLEYSYHETITITPRNYPLQFRQKPAIKEHYALIGTAFVQENYPLYYDAINEKGLGMAGLNFPGNAYYHPIDESKDNIGSFEFIPWVLSQCDSVKQARELLKNINIAAIDFNPQLPSSPLHWMIADQNESIVVESMKDGLKVYDNPVNVLTNNPPFDYQLTHLIDYMGLSNQQLTNNFSDKLELNPYSRGMGGMGLPGDLSSASRFVKAAFTLHNSLADETEESSISQFFHVLTSVEQQRGLVDMGHDQFEITIYSSCANLETGTYYYTTYDNSQITAVDMSHTDLDASTLTSYPMITKTNIHHQN